MPSIIGTIIKVQGFLENKEAKIYVPKDNSENSSIILERDRKYIIPDFQREIRWNQENMIELISDINSGERFLGNIILSKRGNHEYEIIDGQQRITMLLMILRYIKHISGAAVPIFDTCPFNIASFSEFPLLMRYSFDDATIPDSDNMLIDESDSFNQRKRYSVLWESISKSGIVTKGNSRDFLSNLSRCELNILLNTDIDSGHSIRYFLDVNLKGVRLDTEDILKGYLFSFDPSNEIRDEWGTLKKRVFELESHGVKYPLIKIVEQFLYCDLYKEAPFKGGSVKFTEKFLLKSAQTINEKRYYKNDHMVKVINDNEYMLNAIRAINKYLKLIINIVSTDGVNTSFQELFRFNGKRIIEPNEIKVIHNFIKKIMLDENVVPKILVMKYVLDVFYQKDTRNKADVRKIYAVYCLSLLFTVFDDKRSSVQITEIVKQTDWSKGVIRQINKYLNGTLNEKRLSAQYKVFLLSETDDTSSEEDVDNNVALHTSQYRCKSLATIYNYFKIGKEDVTITNHDEVFRYLNDDKLFSTEHFILNKCGGYCIPDSPNKDKTIPYPSTIKKHIDSLFNFIFISEDENKKLYNYHIWGKLSTIEKEPISVECEYSKMVLDICKDFFKDNSNAHDKGTIIEIEENCERYYNDDFIKQYATFAGEVIKKVFEKIRESKTLISTATH